MQQRRYYVPQRFFGLALDGLDERAKLKQAAEQSLKAVMLSLDLFKALLRIARRYSVLVTMLL